MDEAENTVPETFGDLEELDLLSKPVIESLKENFPNHDRMTPIQQRAIPLILSGKNILGTASTGSGKTLAFLVPVIQQIISLKGQQRSGTRVVIITPTRELAIQIASVAEKLVNHPGLSQITVQLAISKGGHGKSGQHDLTLQTEALKRGRHVVVGTPGRLMDLLNNTDIRAKFTNLIALVADETDRLLEAKDMREQLMGIVRHIPKDRATLMFSATQKDDTAGLADLFGAVPTDIGEAGSDRAVVITRVAVTEMRHGTTNARLNQTWIKCPHAKRLGTVFTLVRSFKASGKKAIIFMSTRKAVQFHYSLFLQLGLASDGYELLRLHGEMRQTDRTASFSKFSDPATTGLLFCTDVAARGLDIPDIDEIVQLDPPSDPAEYVHRVGRACRGIDCRRARAILILTGEEAAVFLPLLGSVANVQLKEIAIDDSGPMPLVQTQRYLAEIVQTKLDGVKSMALDAYRSFMLAYQAHPLFDLSVNIRRPDEAAASFGLAKAPKVNLPTINPYQKKAKKKKTVKRQQRRADGRT